MSKVSVTSVEHVDDEDGDSTRFHTVSVVDAAPISSIGQVVGNPTMPIQEMARSAIRRLIKNDDLEEKWWGELGAIRGEYDQRLTAWREFDSKLGSPEKRSTRLTRDTKRLRKAAKELVSAIESLTPETIQLLTREYPDDDVNFLISCGESKTFPPTSAIGLFYAARDSAVMLEREASSLHTLDDKQVELRRKMLRKLQTVERLFKVWTDGAGCKPGSKKFYEFANLVMNGIDPDFAAEHTWRKDPDSVNWMRSEFGYGKKSKG